MVGGALSIAESAPGTTTVNGSLVGKLSATDPDGNTGHLSLIDTAGGRFSIADDGTVRVASALLLDRGDQRQATTSRSSPWTPSARPAPQTFAVNIASVNEAPFTPTLSASRDLVSEASTAPVAASNIGGWVARFN